MPDPDILEREVRAFVANGTTLDSKDVVPGNDPAPRPYDPYATLLLIEDVATAYTITNVLANGETRSADHRRATYSLQFYRKGARALALAFCTYAGSENGLTDASDGEFRVDNIPLSFQRLDDIVGDGYEERALVNLEISYVHQTDQDAGVIDTVTWEAEYGEASTSGMGAVT